jgi:hypothetical protein
MGDLVDLNVGNTAALTNKGSFKVVRTAYTPEEANVTV